ncbi:hypothetical protein BG006_001413 [Podila minutissima]|uniref:RING-type E3 ubiquitin transferase n=1 Tax=Podila minutissima TaxID=64525 RepID=A0A9P5ST57_9FUNG|nr:hypothetical protein BG006_001413 [Podila minutissima]
MDPSPSVESSAASESTRRQGRNRGRANQNQPDTEGAPKNKGRRGNNNNNNNNKGNNKDKDNHRSNKSSEGANGIPRPPQTIAATDSIDLHPGRTAVASTTNQEDQDDDSEQHSCFICTENIVIFAVSDCNHRTCHLCSLRLRALYKTKNCAFCKADQGIMIFTRDAEKPFQEYQLSSMAYFDRKLNVYFEDQEMYEDTMVLLRFNCPDPTCEVACPDGWNQLKSHVKKVHKLMLCDLCVRFKKVFAHEHNLMTASQLMKHFKTGDAGQSKQNSEEPSGFKGHPECGFCKESFYGDDELFEHCKKNHEQCFLCIRRNIRHQYYDKYIDLERHLHSEHHPCMDQECLDKKFVVFDSDLDLRAHEAEQHPHMAHSRTRRDKKIDVGFSYNSAGGDSGSGSGSRRGGRNRQGREEGKAQTNVPSQPQLTPHQIQQIALQQQMALEHERRNNESSEVEQGVSGLSLDDEPRAPQSMLRTRPPAGFGATLSEPEPLRATVSAPNSAAARVAANIQRTSSPRSSSPVVVTQSKSEWPAMSNGPSSSSSSSQPRASQSKGLTPDILSRHAALQERVQQYLQGTSGSLSQFRTLTTQFRNSQIPGNQYVASLAGLFGNELDKTAKIVQGLYEVLDSETKKAEIMRVWRDYKTTQSQFPSLEAAVTSAPTMADIATPSTRRVLVIKSSGTTRGGFGHMKPKSTSTWDRAAAAASSLNRPGSPGTKGNTPVFYPTPQLNSAVPWSTSESSSSSSAKPTSNFASTTPTPTPTRIPGSWAGSSSTSGSTSPASQFRPSTGYARPIGTSSEQFPSLVSQNSSTKPSFGLIAMQKSRSQADESSNGWVTGWNNPEEEEVEEVGKKKKNKKKILFHVG